MCATARRGFSLLETIVALALFAGVLLSMLGAGQVILAALFQSDLRLRSSLFTQSVLDSLRGTTCSRLVSGSATLGSLHAAWSVVDLLEAARVDLAVTTPQRGSAARLERSSALFSCPEP